MAMTVMAFPTKKPVLPAKALILYEPQSKALNSDGDDPRDHEHQQGGTSKIRGASESSWLWFSGAWSLVLTV